MNPAFPMTRVLISFGDCVFIRDKRQAKPPAPPRCINRLVTFSTRWGQAVSPGVSSSDVHSGGGSPLWTVMTGTIRLGKGARREAGSEES